MFEQPEDDSEFRREITRALAQSDASYARAATACGNRDEFAVSAVEKWLSLSRIKSDAAADEVLGDWNLSSDTLHHPN